jgi:hypothetical protein
MADQDVALHLRHKLMGFLLSQAIVAVAELGVADELAHGPRSAGDLAGAVGADPDALRRFLRTLAGEGLFVEQPPGTFGLTEMGQLLRADQPGSLRHFATLMTDEAYDAWGQARYSLRTGRPAFPKVFGEPLFDWLAGNPEAAARFNGGQAGLVELRMQPLLERDWAGVSTVVDIGGGNGALLRALLNRYPGLNGVLLDMPGVAAEAERMLDGTALAGRMRCVGGDFRAAVPAGGDVYVLAQILHDWDDEQATAILRRCRQAMPAQASLLILEQILPEGNRPDPAKLLDLHMLVMLGGRERAITEWRDLLAASQFAVSSVTRHSRSCLIEARPVSV